MTIRYTKVAAVAGGFVEAAFVKQPSQADVAADIATAKAALMAAAASAGAIHNDQRFVTQEQYDEFQGRNVIRIRARVW